MAEQKVLQFKCPKCQTPIAIRNYGSAPSLKINCPSCGFAFMVKIQRQPAPVQTIRQAPPSQSEEVRGRQEDSETEFFQPMPKTGKPTLLLGGVNYTLQLGHNTVGRKSPESTATLQLRVNDPYMSRINAHIDVTRTDRGLWQVVVSSCNERNLVKLNGQPLAMGNRIVLAAGNTLCLGHTNITFDFLP